ncbi:MAG TPA: acyltransferase [Arenicellales bacterium]|nr:acyltransferase [Arenicellales bacterium]
MATRINKTHQSITGGGSALFRYQRVVVGNSSLTYLLYFELCAWLGKVPGALGILLRKVFWPRLFGSCGKGVMFADNIVLRHPRRVHLGDRVILSEGVVLDARHDDEDRVLVLEDDVMLSINVMISCKNGCVRIGENTGLSAHTVIHATNDCPVNIGRDGIIGPKCYLAGGGNYHFDRTDIPIREQGIRPDGGVTLEDDVWLGAGTTVLGGVTVGTGSIAGAGSVISRPVPARSICAGVPAKVIRQR